MTATHYSFIIIACFNIVFYTILISFLQGGQVLRIALSLSTLYGIPIEIENIRAGRPKPGLAAQHLKGTL